MSYVSSKDIAEKWGITERAVRKYLIDGRISGAYKESGEWLIPEDSVKPARKTRKDAGIYEDDLPHILLYEMKNKVKGGIYHKLQVDFAYNSNHIEGNQLTEDQTRTIFETRTIGAEQSARIRDIVEVSNHFRCFDYILLHYRDRLTETYIKRLHQILKSGVDDINMDHVVIGEYKTKGNYAGSIRTASPSKVKKEMADLLETYKGEMGFDDILDFHARFEKIHPFYDGNGRVGRLIMFKQCLKYNVMPFIITDDIKEYYINGLREWQLGRDRGYLQGTCKHAQYNMQAILEYFGIDK